MIVSNQNILPFDKLSKMLTYSFLTNKLPINFAEVKQN